MKSSNLYFISFFQFTHLPKDIDRNEFYTLKVNINQKFTDIKKTLPLTLPNVSSDKTINIAKRDKAAYECPA